MAEPAKKKPVEKVDSGAQVKIVAFLKASDDSEVANPDYPDNADVKVICHLVGGTFDAAMATVRFSGPPLRQEPNAIACASIGGTPYFSFIIPAGTFEDGHNDYVLIVRHTGARSASIVINTEND